jgi:WS/DGAT/MGAT family acyltransferase
VTESGTDRLSGLDRSFLALEGETAHMHIGATLVFDGGSLVSSSGGVDLARMRDYTAARIHDLGRYRQRLAEAPVTRDLFWVDDPDFDIARHVHHMRLPAPGGDVELREIVGHLIAQPLDRGRPLWELWLIEGLAGGRFAVLTKTHHCLVDGVGAVDLLARLLSPTPSDVIPEAPPFRPRPPGSLRLLTRDLVRAATRPARMARALREVRDGDALGAVGESLSGYRLTSRLPINHPIGRARRVDWCSMSLEELRGVRQRLGGTLNDLVLAIATSALRSFLLQRELKVGALDVRALVPVSVRDADARDPGNQIAMWLVDLPVEEADPRLRFEQIRSVTRELKRSSKTKAAAALARVSNWTSTTLMSRAARLLPLARPFNLLITNVPGPQLPLYLLDAKLEAGYPQAPLFVDQGLAVALFSYNGQMFWGLNADRDLVPDLELFRAALLAGCDELVSCSQSQSSVEELHEPA